MKPHSIQFGVRENTASSRQHDLRLAVDSLRSLSEPLPNGLQHRQPAPVLESHAGEPDEPITTKPLDAATGGEKHSEVDHGRDLRGQTAWVSRSPNFEPLLPTEDAAKMLGNIHVKTLQRYAREGRVPSRKIAGHWYFRATELDAWLRPQINSNCQSVR
jgi:Helix-turn-helix domain